ncbi:hypothetical protein Avbf_09124 [Armadillidium vulgare]|nr:hypothetical protein Avbf_09124 [Armadillidium vulgare]
MTDDNGWNTVICSRRTMFDSSRLKSQTFNRNFDNKPPVFSEKFSNWATGNTGGSKNHKVNRNSDNKPPVFSEKFNNWAIGSTGGSKNHEEESSRPFINRFAPLELTPMMDMHC